MFVFVDLFHSLPPGSRIGQMPSTPSQDQLLTTGPLAPPTTSTDVDTTNNNQNNQNNSTSSTTNGVGSPEDLAKSPSMLVSTPNTMNLVNPPTLMSYYDPTGGSGGCYMTHPAPMAPPVNQGSLSTTQRGRKGSSATGVVTVAGSPSRAFLRCSWQYWVILICVLAFLLAVSFAVFFSGRFTASLLAEEDICSHLLGTINTS